MRRRKPNEIRLHIRLYPGQDDDLIQWLEQFNDKPYGAKSQAVKEALRRSIGQPDQPIDPIHQVNPLNRVTLAEVRQVVEAAVATALARFEGQVSGAVPATPPEEDEETEDLLDSLEAALTLQDDEES